MNCSVWSVIWQILGKSWKNQREINVILAEVCAFVKSSSSSIEERISETISTWKTKAQRAKRAVKMTQDLQDIGTYWNCAAQAALLLSSFSSSLLNLLASTCYKGSLVSLLLLSPAQVLSISCPCPLVPFLCATWILTKELLASSGLRNLKYSMFRHVSTCQWRRDLRLQRRRLAQICTSEILMSQCVYIYNIYIIYIYIWLAFSGVNAPVCVRQWRGNQGRPAMSMCKSNLIKHAHMPRQSTVFMEVFLHLNVS